MCIITCMFDTDAQCYEGVLQGSVKAEGSTLWSPNILEKLNVVKRIEAHYVQNLLYERDSFLQTTKFELFNTIFIRK